MLKPVILCVDDEKTVLNSLRQELEFGLGGRYALELAESGEEGLEIIQELMDMGYDIHIVISDQLMPGMKGDQFLIEVNKINPEIRKILLTGQANADAVGNAVNYAGLYRYIAKPWDEKDLRMTVDQAAKSYVLNQQLLTQVKILSDLNKNARILAEEVHPMQLADKYLRSCLLDSGAARGLLQLNLNQQEKRYWAGQRNGFETTILEIDGTQAQAQFPMAIVQAASQQTEALVLHNAHTIGDFAQDPQVRLHSIQSVYASAIAKPDQHIGTLYLEKADSLRYFTTERVELLNLLNAHATICLDNALLYQSLEQKVQERTRTIQEKNQHITDSIEYARRIQLSILPDVEWLNKRFPDSFLYYQSKDIVSGDFYWFAEEQGHFLIAAADCTGHGVPGAFMSVLGANQLGQIVRRKRSTNPAEILSELHEDVRYTLKQYDDQAQIQDGMDMALCSFAPDGHSVQYAGARRALYVFRDGQAIEYKPDRYPIGGSVYNMPEHEQFVMHHINLQAGDTLYMFSDGITDQFGGPDGKRFSSKRLIDLLQTIQPVAMDKQEHVLREHLQAWRGGRAQTDDILIIGIRIQ